LIDDIVNDIGNIENDNLNNSEITSQDREDQIEPQIENKLTFENNGIIILYEENKIQKYKYLYFKNINYYKMDDNKYDIVPKEKLRKLYSIIKNSSKNNVGIDLTSDLKLDIKQQNNIEILENKKVSDLIKELTQQSHKSDYTIVYLPIYMGKLLTKDYMIKDLSYPLIFKSIKRINKLGMELSSSFINTIIQNAGLSLNSNLPPSLQPSLSTITSNNTITLSNSGPPNTRFPFFSNRPSNINLPIQSPSLLNTQMNTIEVND
jgi:hypothetical protein